MSPKNKNMRMHLLYCLLNLLLECLDELQINTEKGKKLKQDITEMAELLNNECNKTLAVRKTTYFQNISNKIMTVIRKEFNPEM